MSASDLPPELEELRQQALRGAVNTRRRSLVFSLALGAVGALNFYLALEGLWVSWLLVVMSVTNAAVCLALMVAADRRVAYLRTFDPF